MRFLLTYILISISSYCYSQDQAQGYVLKSIYFGGGSYYADEYQLQELYDLVDSIPEIKYYTITVHSHTDNIGGAAYNEWLSNMRSETVIAELLNMEFKANQIEIKDFGQFNPVYDNNTWEGRRLNRRVDVIFWPLVF